MIQQRTLLTATCLGALAGLCLAVIEAGSTLAYLQTIPRGFAGLPMPADLDWIAGWGGMARALTATPVPDGLDLIARGALLWLALVVFRELNPELRLTPPLPPAAESGAVLRQPLDRRRLRQIGGAMLVSLWLLGYVGAWLPWRRGRLLGLLLAGPTGLQQLWPRAAVGASVVGWALLLGGLWLVWGEAGLLRPAAGEGRRGGLGRGLAAAALAGIALAPFAMPLAGWAQDLATEVLQGIGGAARSAWLTYLAGVLVVYPLALGTAGWTAVSLARCTHHPQERRPLLAGIAVALAAWLGVGLLLDLAGGGRFDQGVPLARAAGVPAGPRGALMTLTLLPGSRPVIGMTPVVSDQGLTATEASARTVWAYLRWRRFRTVHLFPALMHVGQCDALAWDSDRFLDTMLRGLIYNPHPGFAQLLIEKLAHCAATPRARAALFRLQDPRWFHLPPESGWALWLLRRRLEPEGAEIRGRLWLNGAPARGIAVGLVDERLWEQFRGMPRALTHRLVVASSVVDAAGRFRLRAIPSGRYFLLVGLSLPGGGPPPGVRVQESPGPIRILPGAYRVDIGAIHLVVAAPPPAQSRSARGLTSGQGYFAFALVAPLFSLLMSHLEQQ